jgi:hypothetical protein
VRYEITDLGRQVFNAFSVALSPDSGRVPGQTGLVILASAPEKLVQDAISAGEINLTVALYGRLSKHAVGTKHQFRLSFD